MPVNKGSSLGGFEQAPRKDSFAARVARAKNPDLAVDQSELTEAEKLQLSKASAIDKAAAGFKFVEPAQAIERIEIIFDNSGSMSGQAITDAKEGVTEFMKACVPNETAVRITPLNSTYGVGNEVIKFTCNLPTIAAKLAGMTADGGTPLYAKLKSALTRISTDLNPSRIIAFSDGSATDGWARRDGGEYETTETGGYKLKENQPTTDSETHIAVVAMAKQCEINIDTCLIWDGGGNKEDAPAYRTMKAIADDTGGVFILFEKGKCDFKRGFKYLTKGNRLLLMDDNFKRKLEAGEI